MRTHFTAAQRADPATARSEAAIRKCVHCGFCTATCPTYVLRGDERDSPRGRIALIQNMLEAGGTPDAATVRHIDRCLSCLACTTTCPAGVDYAQLIDHGRAHVAQHYRRPWAERAARALLAAVLPDRQRFAAALRLAPLARWAAPLLARADATRPLAAMLDLAPRAPAPVPPPTPATRHARRVLMLRGCAEPVLAPQIQAATIRLLDRIGIGVDYADEGCCGALVHHIGREAEAQAAARAAIAQWEAALAHHPYEAIIVTASGCGSQLKTYGRLLADDAEFAPRAARIAALARDWSEVVAAAGLPPGADAHGQSIVYHAACSLQHGQKLDTPAALLGAAGFAVSTPAEAHLCCGSAGTYNILQPALAGALRDRKRAALAATGAPIIAGTNIGCIAQLAGGSQPVVHAVELLDWACGGPWPAALPKP